MLKGRNVFLIYFLVSKHNTSIKHQYLDPHIYSFVEEADENISRYSRLTFVACEWQKFGNLRGTKISSSLNLQHLPVSLQIHYTETKPRTFDQINIISMW